MRNLITLLFAATLISGAAMAQAPSASGVTTSAGSTLTTKDGTPVLSTGSDQAATTPAAKPEEPKQAKKKSKKQRAKKPAAKTEKTAEEPAKAAH